MAVLMIGVAAAAPSKDPAKLETSAEKDAYLRSRHLTTTGGIAVVKTDDDPAPLAPDAILYDQLTPASATLNTTSQNFEAAYDIYDNFAADDFVVTGGGWNVTTVVAPGAYSATHGTPASMHVQFYNDVAGLPGGAPLCDFPAATFVEAPVGTFTITVPGCVLSAGTKWVMVRVNLNFGGGGGQWFWTTRTTQSGNGAAWQNPGGGFGTPCASWGRESTCLANAGLIDHTFQLQGSLASCTVDADCADGNLCNGVETCPAGSCVPGTPVNCVDGLFCTQDVCTPATGLCSHPANPCADADGCTTDGCDEANDVCTHANLSQHLCNAGSITIGAGSAVPYPSNILVSGLGTTASVCSVELKGMTHTFPDDIDVLLVGPAGGSQNRTIMSDVGSGTDIVGINLTLTDSAATALPDAGPLVTGTFRPTNITSAPADAWPAPAPAPTGLAPLSPAFSGINPNGTWSLYIVDDSAGDTGTMSAGWCLNIVVSGCTIDTDCTDGNFCNGIETCVASNCQPGTPVNCDDSDLCTVDGCTPATGLCTHDPFFCNDANPCTTDSCPSPAGCLFANNALPCNDANPCTTGEACAGGACGGGTATNCDDAIDCTTDSCSPATGCGHVASTGGACSDGNPCTTGETCAVPCTGSLTENFDGVTPPALPAGWTTTRVVGTGTDIAWVTTTAFSDSAPNSATTDDPSHVTDKVLDSVTLPYGATQVSFRNKFNLEASGGSFFDGAVLEIKMGAGAFVDVITAGGSFVVGGYTGTISTGFSSPIGGRMAWSGNSTTFITTTVNLPPAAAGQSSILRWRVATDTTVSAAAPAGQWVDSITITTCASTCSGGAATPSPGEVTGDTFAPDKATYSWGAALLASTYDVVRGSVSALPVGPGGGDEVPFCNIAGTSMVDATNPGTGLANWYLVRGENTCAAPGTYGTQSNLTPRVTTTCP